MNKFLFILIILAAILFINAEANGKMITTEQRLPIDKVFSK